MLELTPQCWAVMKNGVRSSDVLLTMNPVQFVLPPVEITPTVLISFRQPSPSEQITSTLQAPDRLPVVSPNPR